MLFEWDGEFSPVSSRTSAAKRSADPGPITTGRRLAKTRSDQLVPQQHPGVMGPRVRGDDTGFVASSVRHPMHRADLVAVEVAQVSEIQLAAGALAHAGRILDRLAAGGEAGRMPGIDLLR